MSTSRGLEDYTAIFPNPLPDEEVVARVRAGETALYEILMRRYNQRLFRIARSIVPDDDEAEDIMQDAYVRAFASLEQFAERAQFSTWLAKIALYEAYRRRRKQKYLRPINSGHIQSEDMDTVKSITPNPEQQALSREAISILERPLIRCPKNIAHCLCFVRLRDSALPKR